MLPIPVTLQPSSAHRPGRPVRRLSVTPSSWAEQSVCASRIQQSWHHSARTARPAPHYSGVVFHGMDHGPSFEAAQSLSLRGCPLLHAVHTGFVHRTQLYSRGQRTKPLCGGSVDLRRYRERSTPLGSSPGSGPGSEKETFVPAMCSESRFIDLLTKSWWVGGEAVNLPNPVCRCCWLELVEGSSGVLRIITVVEHLQRVVRVSKLEGFVAAFGRVFGQWLKY